MLNQKLMKTTKLNSTIHRYYKVYTKIWMIYKLLIKLCWFALKNKQITPINSIFNKISVKL